MIAILRILGAAALSGVLLALALPPSDHGWLAPICLVPLLVAVGGKGLLPGFFGGLITPFVLCLTVQSNLIYRIPSDDASGSWVMFGCGFFGFAISIVASVAGESGLTGWRRIVLLACLAVALEFALFPVLPAHLALSQYRYSGMLALASVGGIWLVSWLLWAANAAIAESLRHRQWRTAVITLVCLTFGYGLGYLPVNAGPSLTRVAAIQTDATDSKTLRRLNGEAGQLGAVLAVWPESSGIEMTPLGRTDELRALSAKPGQPAIVTSFNDAPGAESHNVAALFDLGAESKRYAKRKLFGGESKMHLPGTSAVAAVWPGHPAIGLDICFDCCYPRMIAESAGLDHVGLIVLPTADPDSANCFVEAIHASFTPFRAAESGIPIVRADAGGYSQIVDNSGHIIAEQAPGRDQVLVGDVALGRRFSLYSKLGDWVLYVSIAAVFAEILFGRRKRIPAPTPGP